MQLELWSAIAQSVERLSHRLETCSDVLFTAADMNAFPSQDIEAGFLVPIAAHRGALLAGRVPPVLESEARPAAFAELEHPIRESMNADISFRQSVFPLRHLLLVEYAEPLHPRVKRTAIPRVVA